MRKLLYIFFSLFLFVAAGSAQVHFPIRTYTTLTPPTPYSLDGFISVPGKLNLQVVVDDISLQEHPVKLRVSIKGNGIHIYTRPDYTPSPVYLEGGISQMFTGEDLREIFNPRNLIFEGYSKAQYQRNRRMPEGVYRISFDVVDYHRDVVLSRAFPAVTMMYLTQAPRLLSPANSKDINPSVVSTLRFSWITQGITNPMADVFYRFKLWEVRPESRAAEEIVRSTRPLFQTETSQDWLVYDATLPALESGREYVWEVQAIDREGEVLFKNDGKSDVSTFNYGQKCPVPAPYITEVSTNSASLRWNYSPASRLYRVFLRKQGEEEWEESEVSSGNYKIDNLPNYTRYELKVRNICDGCESDESEILKFRTNRVVDYSCGTGAGNFDLSNTRPLPDLYRFDTFKAADFLVEVESVNGENGRFSGTGLLMVPYLRFVKFRVNFDNIFINSDYRMTEGEVAFVYDEATGMVLSEDDFTADPTQTPDYQEVDVTTALQSGTDQQISVSGEVEDISVSNNTVTVTTSNGETQTVTVGEGETVGVSPAEGDQAYVADTSTGRVYSFPKQPSGSRGNVKSQVQSGVYGGKVTFSTSANQRYGVDFPGNGDDIKPIDYFETDKSGNVVAWKSLEAGMTDYIDLNAQGNLQIDSLRYIRTSGFPVPSSPLSGNSNGRSLLLTGGMDGYREMLSVARVTQKSDSSEVLTEVGALGLASYAQEHCYVELVDVNQNEKFPGNARGIEDYLNDVYASAVVKWHVSIGKPIEITDLDHDNFQTGNKPITSSFTKEMRRVYKHYNRKHGAKRKTFYLFFIDYPGADKKGYMPPSSQYGFIFNFGSNFETLAHELAHGAFNLRHPFSPKSTYALPKGETDNLMDYGKPEQGTALWKYQWDLIHDPENVLFAHTEEEEEGAFEIMTHQNLVAAAIAEIEGDLVLNERNFKLLVSTGLLADGGSILCDINREMSNAELTEDLSAYLNTKLDDLYRIYNSPMNVVKEQWLEFWSTSIEFPNMRNAFRRSWQYGKEMKQSAELIAEYGKAIYSSNVKFDKLVITPNNKFKIELKDLTLLEDPDLCFNLLFRMQDYVTVNGEVKSLSLNGQGIDLIPEWMSTDLNVSTQNSLGIKYVNKETQKDLFEITFDVNASLENSVELVMSLNDVPVNFPLTCEKERTEIHFDNKYTSSLVLEEWTKLNSKIENASDPIDLGLCIHNVADFYSHSNFITEYIDWWMEQPNTNIKTLKPEHIPTYEDVVLNRANEWNLDWKAFGDIYKPIMQTGMWDLGKFMDSKNGVPLDLPVNAEYHDDMALDAPDTGEGAKKPDKAALCNYFEYARGAAYKHIKDILENKLK